MPLGKREEREQDSGAQVLPLSMLMQQTSTDRVLKRLVTYNVNSLVAALGRAEGPLLDFIDRNRADCYALRDGPIAEIERSQVESLALLQAGEAAWLSRVLAPRN